MSSKESKPHREISFRLQIERLYSSAKEIPERAFDDIAPTTGRAYRATLVFQSPVQVTAEETKTAIKAAKTVMKDIIYAGFTTHEIRKMTFTIRPIRRIN